MLLLARIKRNFERRSEAPTSCGPRKIILCVDDNEQELSVLKFMLATNGYRVVSANNGQEAIGIFADTAVDLVLSDYAMPQMNGDQLVGPPEADRRPTCP